MMLEVDGLFYHFILILGWKWSSIIYRYWLNQLRYITYEELTLSSILISVTNSSIMWDTLPMRNWHLIAHWKCFCICEIHYLWGIDTLSPPKPNFWYKNRRYITYEELTQDVFIIFWKSSLWDTLPMRNWHALLILFSS